MSHTFSQQNRVLQIVTGSPLSVHARADFSKNTIRDGGEVAPHYTLFTLLTLLTLFNTDFTVLFKRLYNLSLNSSIYCEGRLERCQLGSMGF